MAQYVRINNYSKLGDLNLSYQVFYQIAEYATNKVRGAKVSSKTSRFNIFKPISVNIKKGLVTVAVTVSLNKNANINALCLAIQEEIASSLSAFTEMVPFRIDVKVANLKHLS
ncbi:MAG: Asp23 family, cell envelope-related function [Bacillota bacterium]|jgi:uncharacterized alkaline shock family protein YloU